jgi:hypothetical protein
MSGYSEAVRTLQLKPCQSEKLLYAPVSDRRATADDTKREVFLHSQVRSRVAPGCRCVVSIAAVPSSGTRMGLHLGASAEYPPSSF